jgi:hypothetical protein
MAAPNKQQAAPAPAPAPKEPAPKAAEQKPGSKQLALSPEEMLRQKFDEFFELIKAYGGRASSALTTTAVGFELLQRVATAYARSTLVPKAYQENIPNCMIAVEIASRLDMSPLMVMQNLDIIYGQPAWRAVYYIALLNTCGKYASWRYVFKGEEGTMSRSCKVVAKLKGTGELVEGTTITMAMAKAEGWLDRKDREGKLISKWQTMPEHMIRNRAASFFGRENIADRTLGIRSVDEVADFGNVIDVTPAKAATTGVAGAKELLKGSPASS